MSACSLLPTFHNRLLGNFGISTILSILSLSFVISQKLIDSSEQIQQQKQTSWNVFDCNQPSRDSNQDLLQGDTSDEGAKIKRQPNLSADCMIKQFNSSPSSSQQNANNHELATSVEPIYFGRYSPTGDLGINDRRIYGTNQRKNPLTSSFYMLGSESPQYQEEEENRKLAESIFDDRLNYSYNGSDSVKSPSKLPLPKANNKLDSSLDILKPFEKLSASHRREPNSPAKRFAIPLAELAHRQFELSSIYGIKQDDTRDYDARKYEDKPGRQKPLASKQLKSIDTQGKTISSKERMFQQARDPMKILNEIQDANLGEGKNMGSSKKEVTKSAGMKMKDKDKVETGSKFLNDLYRSSILKRLRQKPGTGTLPASISELMKPGDVLLAEKKTHNKRKQQPDKEVAVVKPSDIVGLLRKLKPLTVSEYEKPEAEKLDHENRGIDEEFELEKEELEELKRQNKVDRVLPTSHLFGGSVGVVNATRIEGSDLGNEKKGENGDDGDNDLESIDEDDEQEGESDENEGKNKTEDAKFLKVLTDLGSRIGKEPHSGLEIQPIDSEFYELYGNNKPKKRRKLNQNDGEKLYTFNSGSSNDDEKTVPPIAIEALVDHLMSSSRLATFGVQHTGVKVPRSNDGYEDDHEPPSNDEEEDEDNNGDDDADNNDTLPPIEEKEAESNVRETKVLPDFNSVANMSDTWIPLDSVKVNDKQLLLNKNGYKAEKVKSLEGVLNSEMKSSKTRRKRGKSMRTRRKKKGDLVLIIGDKMLSRTDLIRLIRVLNKISSKKEASREREASRRLLKFLVKLALEEYRKNKESNSTNSLDDPIREVLRSILDGPVYGKQSESNKGNVADTGQIQLRPLKPINLNEGETKFAEEAHGGNDTKRDPMRKSLKDVTDDLDLYFESDFFEDLADKRDNSSKTASSGYIRVTKLKPDNQHNKKLKKLKRASRLGYSLPVPIYGKQHFEAADEDDVGLDHVRSKGRPTKRRPHLKGNDDDDDDDDYEVPKRSLKKSRKSSRDIKSRAPSEEEDNVAQDPEPDEERQSEPDEEPTTRSKDNGIIKLNNPSHSRRIGNSKSKAPNLRRSQNGAEDNDDTGEPDPSSVITDEVDSDTESEDDPDSEPDKVPGAENLEVNTESSNKVAPRRRRKRRRRVSDNARRKLIRGNEVDLEDRDEIPAPISNKLRIQPDDSTEKVSGRSTKAEKTKRKFTSPKKNDVYEQQHRMGTSAGAGSNQVDTDNTPKPKTKRKSIDTPNGKMLNTKNRPRKRNARHKSSEYEAHEADRQTAYGNNNDNNYLNPDEPASEEPQPIADNSDQGDASEPQDKDYFNEDTSYSKVCEEDGGCHVSVRSSSPKLSKAIKARDKQNIVKQLGNWIAQND